MSFLAPLYALGALAVALPVLFHLIQRRPRGQLLFSSLMFLSPSTPRITRRSRLSHLLLLFLRAAALIFLALAFSRPFLRSLQQLTTAGSERRVAIVLDRSASMRRDSLWDQALAQAQDVLSGLGPNDRLAIFGFDEQLEEFFGFRAGVGASTAEVQLARETLGQLQPGWGATNLGNALTEVVERMRVAARGETGAEQLIVLISDLQRGSQLDSLQSTSWPPDVRLDVRQVRSTPGNATLRWLPLEAEDDPSLLRVRVTNGPQATRDSLQLAWQGKNDLTDVATLKSVQVPPGRSRVVTIQRQPPATQLILRGDAHAFDNVAFLAPLQAVEKRLLFVGDGRDEQDRLYFFLKRVQLGTLQHPVRVDVDSTAIAPDRLDPLEMPLVVLARPLSPEWTDPLRQYLQRGGRVLVVMDPSEYAAEGFAVETQWLQGLLELDSLNAEMVDADAYAILGQIDFQNPLFQPFADAQFNDFTNIRVWQYYRVTTNHEQPWTVLARFDDDSLALAEKVIGEGRLWILTTGWCPDSSQLALSTKFVPLLVSMLGTSIEPTAPEGGLVVGQPVDLSRRNRFDRVVDPRGQVSDLAANQQVFALTQQPGIYRFEGDSDPWEVAVNLAPSESDTEPLDLAELEQRGVLLGSYEGAEKVDQRERQMRDVELESRQKLWRWLVVAALSLLAVETYLAGRTSSNRLLAEPGEG